MGIFFSKQRNNKYIEEELEKNLKKSEDNLIYRDCRNSTIRSTTDFFSEKFIEQSHSDHEHPCDKEDIDLVKYDLLTNVCICMIDIVGFSSWCSNHIPHVIAKSMIEYNALMCKTIERYYSLKKIELVGDCCMILSGTMDVDYKYSCLNTIRFAVDILDQLHEIRNIFKSKYIGVRIGIHLSDVIGVYIENPDKYQMFGNDINICSRLESSAKSNTIHISEKTLMCVQDLCKSICGPCRKCVKGECIKQSYKGVGTKTSYIYYLKSEKALLLYFDSKSYAHINMNVRDVIDLEFDTSEKISLSNYESFQYVCVLIALFQTDTFDEISMHIDKILNIDKDKVNSGITQQVTLVLCKNEEDECFVKKKYPYKFDHIINVTDQAYIDICKNILEKNKSRFKGDKGSLDLYVN